MAGEASLLKLNDDCLFEVFSWLSVLDLCNVRSSCSRLKKVTEDYFGRTYSSLQLHHVSGRILYDSTPVKLREMRRILSAFGHNIEALTLNSGRLQSGSHAAWLRSINAFCAHHQLKQLKLLRFHFDEKVLSDFTHPFKNVEELTIDKCTNHGMEIEKTVAKCTDLKFLALTRDKSLRGGNLNSNWLRQINPRDAALLRFLLTPSPNRSTHNYTEEMMKIAKLEKLCGLDIDLSRMPVLTSFLNALTSKIQLTSLGLANVPPITEVFAAIAKLTNLQKLKLISVKGSVRADLIKLIAAPLTNLKELHVFACNFVTLDVLIQFVADAPKLENLVISGCSKIRSINQEQCIRLGEACAKRPGCQELILHCDKLHMADVHEQTKQKYSKCIRFVELSADLREFAAFYRENDEYSDDFDYYDLGNLAL